MPGGCIVMFNPSDQNDKGNWRKFTVQQSPSGDWTIQNNSCDGWVDPNAQNRDPKNFPQ
jgi:hypothetical protein